MQQCWSHLHLSENWHLGFLEAIEPVSVQLRSFVLEAHRTVLCHPVSNSFTYYSSSLKVIFNTMVLCFGGSWSLLRSNCVRW